MAAVLLYFVGVLIACVGYFAGQGQCDTLPPDDPNGREGGAVERAPAMHPGPSSAAADLLHGATVLYGVRRAVESNRCNFSSVKPASAKLDVP